MGLNFGYHGSVTVVSNGVILSHVVTGKETDKKMARGVTKTTIKKALDDAELRLKDINMAPVVNWYADRDTDGLKCLIKLKVVFQLPTTKELNFL